MPYRDTATVRHALPRDVYSQPYGSGRVYFYVTSDGTEGRYRFPLAGESVDDVVIALADELDRVDPLPRSSSAPRAPAVVRVLRQRLRDAVVPPPARLLAVMP
jgi:hypothetical protein